MGPWQEFEESAPELAAAVRQRFDVHRHAVLATLRKDGSPRVSGIETTFAFGELWLGMMPGSRKALDLRRDPRLALHSASVDPPDDAAGWGGDAKVSGRAEEITDPERVAEVAAAMAGGEGAAAEEATGQEPATPGAMHLFRVDVDEAVLIRVGDPADHLVIELWRPGEGVRRTRRD